MAVINIRDVPEDLYIRAKIYAVKKRFTLKALVIAALKEYLDRHEGKGGE